MARTSNIYQEERIPSPLQQTWRNFSSNPISMIGLWTIALLLLVSLLAPFIAPYDADHQNVSALLKPPSWHDDGYIDHFLGTDDLGRDIFSRLLYGTRATFGNSLIVVSCSLLIGGAIGVLSGMSHGLKSSFLNHLLDATLAIPSLLLAIVFVAISGPGMTNVMLAVGIALIPQFVRAIHNVVHQELSKEYVVAAKLDGANSFHIFTHTIFPNLLDAIIVQITLAMSAAIMEIATLGFLNLGAQAPYPEWGTMLSQGLDLLFVAPWAVTLPGMAIFISVLATNLVGDGLQRALKERIA